MRERGVERHGRRAVVRWAWRMFRGEWRQQAVVLALLTFTVAASVVGMAVAYNAVPLRAGQFGDAQQRVAVDGVDAGVVEAAEAAFGTVEVVGHRAADLPGSTEGLDLRAQDPHGPYGAPMLSLRGGRYPNGPGETALTDAVAAALDADLGDVVALDGARWTVVGRVENPADLADEFALVGGLDSPDRLTLLVDGTEAQIDRFLETAGDGAAGRVEYRGQTESTTAAVVALAGTTVVLLLVSLVAAAGFVVVAQRRLRQLGLLAAVGGSPRHVRLVMLTDGALVGLFAAVVGSAVGVGAWWVVAPRIEASVGHRIDAAAVPWGLVALGLVLATVTATLAAWWPAVSISRVPVVRALEGRPPGPRLARRSALLAALLLVVGPVGVAQAGNPDRALVTIGGVLATIAAVLLLSVNAVRVLDLVAAHVPVAVRLAFRDLGRYQARSGAALAAIGLGLGIPVAIVVGASAAAPRADEGNLSDRQLLVLVEGTRPAEGLVAERTPTEIDELAHGVDDIAGRLGDAVVVPLDMAVDPDGGVEASGRPVVFLAEPIGGTNHGRELYVATPEVLRYHGVDPGSVDPGTDVLAAPRDRLWPNDDRGPTGPLKLEVPDRAGTDVAVRTQTLDLPGYTDVPISLVTPTALAEHGWESVRAGWLVEADGPITDTALDQVRSLAGDAGLEVEARDPQTTLAALRSGATAAGMALALGILAMAVALVRGEAGGDLAMLTATGATSRVRRAITGATAGGLALLGVVLATGTAYLTLGAGYIGELDRLRPVPWVHLTVIAVGVPVLAAASGWIVSGREPAALTQGRLE